MREIWCYSIRIEDNKLVLHTVLPFQPDEYYSFPKRNGRCCQPNWFKSYRWLHYDKKNDYILCHTCAKAYHCNLIPLPKEAAFVTTGFSTWSKATQAISKQEKSDTHSTAQSKLLSVLKSTPINVQLSLAAMKQQKEDWEATMQLSDQSDI